MDNHPATSDVAPDILERLMRMQIAGCTCFTKTPDPIFHSIDCRYRTAVDAETEIIRLRATVKNLCAALDEAEQRGIERACGAICEDCAAGLPVEKANVAWFHYASFNAVRCAATPIRALKVAP